MSSCAVCGHLSAQEEWGNPWGSPPTPAPPNFERLEWCGQSELDLYRCPGCGAYFDLLTESSSPQAGNSSWDNYTLSRHRGHSVADLADTNVAVRRDAARLLALDLSRAGDFEGLDRLLLRHADSLVCLAALDTLAELAVDSYPPPVYVGRTPEPDRRPVGLDLVPLEPALRELLAGPPEIAKAGVRVLARHLLRQGRQPELESLLESDHVALRIAAMNVLQDAKKGFPP